MTADDRLLDFCQRHVKTETTVYFLLVRKDVYRVLAPSTSVPSGIAIIVDLSFAFATILGLNLVDVRGTRCVKASKDDIGKLFTAFGKAVTGESMHNFGII